MIYLNAAKTIGPWSGWLRRGFDLFLTAQESHGLLDSTKQKATFVKSLNCYLFAGELGYEVAQSNAAYILRSKLKAMTLVSQSDSTKYRAFSSNSEKNSLSRSETDRYKFEDILYRLLLREYALSGELHQQPESLFQLGNVLFTGSHHIKRDYKKAMQFYQRASVLRHGVATAYLGVIYHFGIGLDQQGGANLDRAARYYEEALKTKSIESQQLKLLITSLQAALGMNSYSFLSPISLGVEYVVKMLWAQ